MFQQGAWLVFFFSEKASILGQERLVSKGVGVWGVNCSVSSCPIPAGCQAHPSCLTPRKRPTSISCAGERCGTPGPPSR